ncbi:MAG: hypothetical protein AAF708_08580 [Deinococcota bacterium]
MQLKDLIHLCEHYSTLGFEARMQLAEMLKGNFSDVNSAAYDIIKDFLTDASLRGDQELSQDTSTFFEHANTHLTTHTSG